MMSLIHDLRYGIRALARSPGFTIVAVLTLALGIGANSAIFSVVQWVLLRPLPFADPDRLVLIAEHNLSKGWERFAVSPANFLDWRERCQTFDSLAIANGVSLTLLGTGAPERLSGLAVSSELLSLLGVRPALGRTFHPGEDRPGAARVAVLGHELWQRRFGADPSLVGRTITLDGDAYTVVGVMPPGFRFTAAQIFVPMALTADQLGQRGSHWVFSVGRLAPDASLEAAQAELAAIAASLAERYPDTNRGWGVRVDDMHENAVRHTRPALTALSGAVAFVLLIACANVANLLLARANGRRHELAVRAALGARRVRLVRQLLTESLLLALAGGALGLLVAVWGIDALPALAADSLPRVRGIAVDRTTLLFTIGTSLATVVLFGLAPALAASRDPARSGMREGTRAGFGGRGRLRSALVVCEMALALVLLIGAGLLLESFRRVSAVSPGFDADHVLTLEVSLPASRYPEEAQQARFFDAALEKLAALPGVEAAGASTVVPLVSGDEIYSFVIDGRPEVPVSDLPSANYYAASADYFRTLGIPLRKGRYFTEADTAAAAPVAIIDESFARRYFPGEDPLGQRLRIGNRGAVAREIVGVVGEVTHYALESGPTTAMYEPYRQQAQDSMTIVLRSRTDPAALTTAARRAVLEVDPAQPVYDVRTMDQVIAGSLADRRLPMLLLAIFAGAALLLAALGLYGVVSYAVAQRTHELGVRMALGAGRADVVRLVLSHGMGLALAGVGLGLCAALLLTRAVSRLLFGVQPTDPIVYGALSVGLVCVALVASLLPAHRATRVDPLAALRNE
jgi:putative ABC transport system permease protein